MNCSFKPVIASLFLASIAVISCTRPEDRAMPPEQQQVPKASPEAAANSATDTVKIVAMKFVPDVITVKPGTTIVFLNKDMVNHDVTEEAHQGWTSNVLVPQKSWSMTADKSANYFCSLHTVMKGKIVVTQ
jgi:plastocyanin